MGSLGIVWDPLGRGMAGTGILWKRDNRDWGPLVIMGVWEVLGREISKSGIPRKRDKRDCGKRDNGGLESLDRGIMGSGVTGPEVF